MWHLLQSLADVCLAQLEISATHPLLILTYPCSQIAHFALPPSPSSHFKQFSPGVAGVEHALQASGVVVVSRLYPGWHAAHTCAAVCFVQLAISSTHPLLILTYPPM